MSNNLTVSRIMFVGITMICLCAGCTGTPGAVSPTSLPLPAPTSTPTPTPTDTPSSMATVTLPPVPVGDLVVLFFRHGCLWRTDVAGSSVEQIPTTCCLAGEHPDAGLLSAESFYSSLQFSPDGRWLIMHNAGLSTWLFDLREQESLRISEKPLRVTWSPDSRRFAYVNPPVETGEGELLVYDIHQRAVKRLFQAQSLEGALWSPDERQIATWAYNDAAGGEVWLIDTLSGAELSVGSYAASLDLPVRWSADGRQLAMTRLNDATHFVEWTVLSLESGSLEQVASLPVAQEWLPDPDSRNLRSISHSGAYLAQAIPPSRMSGQEKWWATSSALRITAVQTEAVVHEWEVPGLIEIVRWSPGDEFLLMNILQVDETLSEMEKINSSIWRLPADGTAELQEIVPDGFLLEVLSP